MIDVVITVLHHFMSIDPVCAEQNLLLCCTCPIECNFEAMEVEFKQSQRIYNAAGYTWFCACEDTHRDHSGDRVYGNGGC